MTTGKDKGHEWQRSRFTATITCAKCGLLPLDSSDYETPCRDTAKEGTQ